VRRADEWAAHGGFRPAPGDRGGDNGLIAFVLERRWTNEREPVDGEARQRDKGVPFLAIRDSGDTRGRGNPGIGRLYTEVIAKVIWRMGASLHGAKETTGDSGFGCAGAGRGDAMLGLGGRGLEVVMLFSA